MRTVLDATNQPTLAALSAQRGHPSVAQQIASSPMLYQLLQHHTDKVVIVLPKEASGSDLAF